MIQKKSVLLALLIIFFLAGCAKVDNSNTRESDELVSGLHKLVPAPRPTYLAGGGEFSVSYGEELVLEYGVNNIGGNEPVTRTEVYCFLGTDKANKTKNCSHIKFEEFIDVQPGEQKVGNVLKVIIEREMLNPGVYAWTIDFFTKSNNLFDSRSFILEIEE